MHVYHMTGCRTGDGTSIFSLTVEVPPNLLGKCDTSLSLHEVITNQITMETRLQIPKS